MGRLASDILLGIACHLRDVAWFDCPGGRSRWMESKDMARLVLVNLVRWSRWSCFQHLPLFSLHGLVFKKKIRGESAKIPEISLIKVKKLDYMFNLRVLSL